MSNIQVPPLCRFRYSGEDQKAWCECGQWMALLTARSSRAKWKDYWLDLHVSKLDEARASYCAIPYGGHWRVHRNGIPTGGEFKDRRAALAAICGLRRG